MDHGEQLESGHTRHVEIGEKDIGNLIPNLDQCARTRLRQTGLRKPISVSTSDIEARIEGSSSTINRFCGWALAVHSASCTSLFECRSFGTNIPLNNPQSWSLSHTAGRPVRRRLGRRFATIIAGRWRPRPGKCHLIETTVGGVVRGLPDSQAQRFFGKVSKSEQIGPAVHGAVLWENTAWGAGSCENCRSSIKLSSFRGSGTVECCRNLCPVRRFRC